jgi:hypothetical protein
MLKKIFFLIVAASVSVAAQSKVLQVKPIAVDVQKVVATKNIARVAALSNADKLNKTKELLKNKVEPAKLNTLELFAPVSLTVRNSFIEEKAFLVFDSPETISAYENSAVFYPTDSLTSKLKVIFNAPGPGFYVFDFAIRKGPSGNTTAPSLRFIDFGFNVTERKLDAPQDQRQLFALQVGKAGWNGVFLDSQNIGWRFLGVEISQVK